MNVLRLWLIATGVIAVGLALWAFAPVVIFLLLLTGALGTASAVMIGLARLLRARLDRNSQPPEGTEQRK
jgi:hypothetical protein